MQPIPEENIRSASEGLRALAHEVRLSVLCHLMAGPLCVQDLMQATGTSQSNLSQHLAKMRMMGLVKTEKDGQRVIYSIASPEIGRLLEALRHMYCPDECSGME